MVNIEAMKKFERKLNAQFRRVERARESYIKAGGSKSHWDYIGHQRKLAAINRDRLSFLVREA